MMVVGGKLMFEIQILVLVVMLMRDQTQAEKFDDTGELSSFGGANIKKPNIENGLLEQYSNVRHIHNPQEYHTNMKEFREEDTNEIMHKFDKLENI